MTEIPDAFRKFASLADQMFDEHISTRAMVNVMYQMLGSSAYNEEERLRRRQTIADFLHWMVTEIADDGELMRVWFDSGARIGTDREELRDWLREILTYVLEFNQQIAEKRFEIYGFDGKLNKVVTW